MLKTAGGVALLALVLPFCGQADVTYTYIGTPYTTSTDPALVGTALTGYITYSVLPTSALPGGKIAAFSFTSGDITLSSSRGMSDSLTADLGFIVCPGGCPGGSNGWYVDVVGWYKGGLIGLQTAWIENYHNNYGTVNGYNQVYLPGSAKEIASVTISGGQAGVWSQTSPSSPVPELSSMSLLGVWGIFGLAGVAWRKFRSVAE